MFLKLYIFSILVILSLSSKPIIGILANPEPIESFDDKGDLVVGSYVRWLESFGAEVVTIHQWYNEEQLETLLSKINGVLFQGGGRDFNFSAPWEKNGIYVINYAKRTGLPLWGTCMGFQFICDGILAEEILEKYNDMSLLHPAILTEKSKTCKTYSKFTPADFDIFEKKDSTIYFHSFGVSEEGFNAKKELVDLFDITSFGVDKDNKKFINSIESKTGNIFGTQYHPEKNPYIRTDYDLEHTIDGLRMSHKVGLGFISVVRQNTNRMPYQDRKQYDFINTFSKGTEKEYRKDDNSYYFERPY